MTLAYSNSDAAFSFFRYLRRVQLQNVSHFFIGLFVLDFERFYQVLSQTLVRFQRYSGLLLLNEGLNIVCHQFKHRCKHTVKLLESIVLICQMLTTVPFSLLSHGEDVSLHM